MTRKTHTSQRLSIFLRAALCVPNFFAEDTEANVSPRMFHLTLLRRWSSCETTIVQKKTLVTTPTRVRLNLESQLGGWMTRRLLEKKEINWIAYVPWEKSHVGPQTAWDKFLIKLCPTHFSRRGEILRLRAWSHVVRITGIQAQHCWKNTQCEINVILRTWQFQRMSGVRQAREDIFAISNLQLK